MARNTTVAKAASAPVKAAPKARKPKAEKPTITLPEGYRSMNRTSLTALYKRLTGDTKAAKFATRSAGREALEALVA
jgi:hypothetical protein